MDGDYLGFEGGAESRTPPKHPLYDIAKDFLPTAVAVAGMILSSNSRWGFWAFSTLAFVFAAAAGIYPAAVARIRARRERERDADVLDRELPRFRQFVHSFGDFVGNQSNTLHAVIQGGLSGTALRDDLSSRLDPTMAQALRSFWELFCQRIDRAPAALESLRHSIVEFTNMICQYHNLCITPIFQRLPQEIRHRLTSEDKSKLDGFLRRHQKFVGDYEQFLRELDESRPALGRIATYLPTADPL